MSNLLKIFGEIGTNFYFIRRLGYFNQKSTYSDNYLGGVWAYLDPIIYITLYLLIIGQGVYNGSVAGQPYLLWLLVGMIPWYYIKDVFNDGLVAVSSQLGMLTKTQYPISAALVVSLFQGFRRFIVLMVVFTLISIFGYHNYPTVYWLQFFYATAAMIATLFAHTLINSTLSILIPDYKRLARSFFRILLFTSGVIFNIDAKGLSFVIAQMIKLFPFYYVISQFRNAFLYNVGISNDLTYTLFFWSLTMLMLVLGANLHMRFRDSFMDRI